MAHILKTAIIARFYVPFNEETDMKKNHLMFTAIAASLVLAACDPQAGRPAGAAPAASTPAASGTAHAAASGASSAPVAGLDTDSKKLGYMLGYEFATQIQMGEMKKNGVEIDIDSLMQGMNDQMAGKPTSLPEDQARAVLDGVSKKMQEAALKRASEASAAGEKFLSENKTKEGIKTTESGLQYKVNKEGTGAQIGKGDLASVEYEGRLTDGTVFDGTKLHGGQAFDVPVIDGAVIAGWIEGLQLMKEGGEYTLYIPAKLAYGERDQAKIPANSVLVFDIKVNKVEKDGANKLMQQAQQQQQAPQQASGAKK